MQAGTWTHDYFWLPSSFRFALTHGHTDDSGHQVVANFLWHIVANSCKFTLVQGHTADSGYQVVANLLWHRDKQLIVVTRQLQI